jgi:hypothetical protein
MNFGAYSFENYGLVITFRRDTTHPFVSLFAPLIRRNYCVYNLNYSGKLDKAQIQRVPESYLKFYANVQI